MAFALHDPVTGTALTLLSAEESRIVAAHMAAFLAAERSSQRNPRLVFADRVQDIVDVLDRTAARHRLAANGHASDAVTRDVAANGHAAPTTPAPSETMVDVKEIAATLDISERQARRIAAARGVKRGGAWVMSRAALEELRA